MHYDSPQGKQGKEVCPRGLRLIIPHDQALNLERTFRHRVKYSLASDVGMNVSVDGLALLSVADLSFRDLFSQWRWRLLVTQDC